MTRRRYVQLDVFASRAGDGNPLAVVLDAEGLDDARMQAIARWTRLPETTFVLPPVATDATHRIRIFSPRREVPFADGHRRGPRTHDRRAHATRTRAGNRNARRPAPARCTCRIAAGRTAAGADGRRPPLVAGGAGQRGRPSQRTAELGGDRRARARDRQHGPVRLCTQPGSGPLLRGARIRRCTGTLRGRRLRCRQRHPGGVAGRMRCPARWRLLPVVTGTLDWPD